MLTSFDLNLNIISYSIRQSVKHLCLIQRRLALNLNTLKMRFVFEKHLKYMNKKLSHNKRCQFRYTTLKRQTYLFRSSVCVFTNIHCSHYLILWYCMWVWAVRWMRFFFLLLFVVSTSFWHNSIIFLLLKVSIRRFTMRRVLTIHDKTKKTFVCVSKKIVFLLKFAIHSVAPNSVLFKKMFLMCLLFSFQLCILYRSRYSKYPL